MTDSSPRVRKRRQHRPRPPVEPLVYTPQEAADALRISRPMIYKLIDAGDLRSLKIGSRRMIPLTAIEALLDGAE